MPKELNLRFPHPEHVIVSLDGDDTETLDFSAPLTVENRQDIRWYLETYATQYTADVDDERAERIRVQLSEWGKALFDAAFSDRAAGRLFNDFQDDAEPGRLLTISAAHPKILSLPWELLHDPAAGGKFLFHENPRISIRRRIQGAMGGRKPLAIKSKLRLRLLLVVSRPSDASFIDPRSDPQAVLDALDESAAGRVDVEFLRPATLEKLVERLEDEGRPPIDLIHFDGHGVFYADGQITAAAKNDHLSLPAHETALLKTDGAKPVKNTGYLLFEEPSGETRHVSAPEFSSLLHRQRVSMVVLSACQSATVGEGEEPMGSVAAQLTTTGIPAVLAMTHSVLVSTTRQLFGAFYGELAKGRGIGTALDNARRHLYFHPEKHEVPRGEDRVTLKLYDWFVPALYQAGADMPLLTKPTEATVEAETAPALDHLPELEEAGFFGRRRELWNIERWFVSGTRRVTITGFGGMGKTYLAGEAGRWLLRTGMFSRVAFVSYASFQGIDPVGLAVSTLATVLDRNLLDAKAATDALVATPTLVILDNLETLAAEPLGELLSAAKDWSGAKDSRVILTTRVPDFKHPDYRNEESLKHRSCPLAGLAADDAIDYFQRLMTFPPAPKEMLPKREALLNLFKLVDFHPLSIRLLARQLKTRRPAELGERLEQLLADHQNNPLIASLNLSLDRLDDEARKWLPKLGVFRGGAFEYDLLEIIGLGQTLDTDDATIWPGLRDALVSTALIQVENVPGVRFPYIKFHPTLGPAVWERLLAEEQDALRARHRERYYQVSRYLYQQDQKNPHQARAIVRRELPNLLYAVYGALSVGEASAVEFAEYVNLFLNVFGLNRDCVALAQRAERAGGERGSQTWFLALSNRGEQLFDAGDYAGAEAVFADLLAGLRAGLSYERCATLTRLGRCFKDQGRPDTAAEHYRQALAVADGLEATENVTRHRGVLQTDLGNVLAAMGDYQGARDAYEAASAIDEELGDLRGVAVDNMQLGSLALREGDLADAAARYREALGTFRRLNEPASEAAVWHQLGIVYYQAQQFDEAERALRESARIKEAGGNLVGAANSWDLLATVCDASGKPDAAEGWYRKALDGRKAAGDRLGTAQTLNNLADLLQNIPDRLAEARALAQESLAIKKTLEPGAAEIWTTYNILANIAAKQGDDAGAKAYRRQARGALSDFPGTRHELEQYAGLIEAVVGVVRGNVAARNAVGEQQKGMRESGAEQWTRLADMLDALLAGAFDPAMLDELHPLPGVIMETILQRLSG